MKGGAFKFIGKKTYLKVLMLQWHHLKLVYKMTARIDDVVKVKF